MRFRTSVAALLLVVGSAAPTHAQRAVEWRAGNERLLPPLPGSNRSSASAINDLEQIVGYSFGPIFDPSTFRATEWTGNDVLELDGLPGTSGSVAEDINGAGIVVGYSGQLGIDGGATEWVGGIGFRLDGLAGSTWTEATAINSTGQVVGNSCSLGQGCEGVLWSGGQVIALGLTEPNDINDAGHIVGLGTNGPAEWTGDGIIDLGGLPGATYSIPYALNNDDLIVGVSYFSPPTGGAGEVGTFRAVAWIDGIAIDLGGLPDHDHNTAYDVNDLGQIVGCSGDREACLAVEWSDGTVDALPGYPGAAFGINDAGQIVGEIPEASTWVMLLVGLCGLSVVAYGRSLGVRPPTKYHSRAVSSGCSDTDLSGPIGRRARVPARRGRAGDTNGPIEANPTSALR